MSSVNKFKNQIRNAKRKSWRAFCSGVEGHSETIRLRKILASSPSVPSFIQKPCGSWTTSGQETLDVLTDTYFPLSLPLTEYSALSSVVTYDVPITEKELRWALKSFAPFKYPSLEGLGIHQSVISLIRRLLTNRVIISNI